MAAPVRIRMLRNTIIEGHGEAKAGEEFEVSPYIAAMLAGEGAAEYVTPQAKGYVTMTLAPQHGDPAPRKVACRLRAAEGERENGVKILIPGMVPPSPNELRRRYRNPNSRFPLGTSDAAQASLSCVPEI